MRAGKSGMTCGDVGVGVGVGTVSILFKKQALKCRA